MSETDQAQEALDYPEASEEGSRLSWPRSTVARS